MAFSLVSSSTIFVDFLCDKQAVKGPTSRLYSVKPFFFPSHFFFL